MGETLLLVPEQSAAGLDAFREQGISIKPLKLAPGDVLAPIKAHRIASQPDHENAQVLIADCRCSAALAYLREQGIHAARAGNRVYGGDVTADEIAALAGDTLSEQLAMLTASAPARRSARLDAQEPAWQRDGWAGLAALGHAWSDASPLLETRQGPLTQATVAAQTSIRCDLDDLLIAAAPTNAHPHLADLLQTPWSSQSPPTPGYRPNAPCPAEQDAGDYEQARCRHRPVAVKPILLLRHRDETFAPAAIEHLEYLAPLSLRGWLADLLQEPMLHRRFELVLTVGHHRLRLAATPRPNVGASACDALISRLLGVALVTGRPLREYDCTLYLPLDLATDAELQAAIQRGTRSKAIIEPDAIAHGPPITVAPPERAVTTLNDAMTVGGNDRRTQDCALSRGELTPDQIDAQTLLYFLPALQRRIFQTNDDRDSPARLDRLQQWRLPINSNQPPELHVQGPRHPRTETATSAKAAIQEVSLFRYYNGLCVLAIRLGFTDQQRRLAERFRGDGDDWWHALLSPAPGADSGMVSPVALQAERWLWLTKSARLLRPAFPQQGLEGKLPEIGLLNWGTAPRFTAEHPFSPIVLALLQDMLPGLRIDAERLLQVRDDRMFVNVVYALAGPPPNSAPASHDAFERLFSLALYLDHAADGFASQAGYAYDRDFIRQRLTAQTDRRWQGIGSLYGTTSYSHVAVGFGDYFAGPVARVHIPQVHGRMLLLALCHELTLRHFDRLVTVATRGLAALDGPPGVDAAGEGFSELQRRFIRFTNDHWFRQVTSQTQGSETYERITKALGLQAQYALVKDKLERSDQYLEQRRGRQLANTANRIASGARWVALIALTIGILAIGSHGQIPSFAELVHLVLHKPFWASVEGVFNGNWNFVVAAMLAGLILIVLLSIVINIRLRKALRWLRNIWTPNGGGPR